MPIYEFRCRDCDHVFDELVMSSAVATEVRCARCKSAKVEKLLSAFAVNTPASASASSKAPKAGPRSGPCGSHCACHGS
jgi:putative FmdB family regulatory protein